ncbi:MAG: enoyl-ACP reductase [Acidobacteriota bacterium]
MTGLILGIANQRSLAYAIAQATSAAGAKLIATYQNERLRRNVEPLAATLNNPLVLQCDVASDEQILRLFASIRENTDRLDFVVHAIAYALRDDLEGEYVDTSREGFRVAHDVSAYSLTVLARHAAPLMTGTEEVPRGGSIVTLTYLGGQRVIPHYNVMGVAKAALESSVRYLAYDLGKKNIRVNAIAAGPVRTLAAAGISRFSWMLHHQEAYSPLGRNIEPEEVGAATVFLVSHMARSITGQILHVDCGYHIMGT